MSGLCVRASSRACAPSSASITSQPSGKEFLSLAGPGFRDFTRIAASDAKMWRDILLANKQELLEQCSAFRRSLQAMELMIETGNGDGLEEVIDKASQTRADWRMGPGRK
jgi:prephenate dehydrogenase